MGRPPIKTSGVAMTNAERQRRRRLKVAKAKRGQGASSAAHMDAQKWRLPAVIHVPADLLFAWFREALREDDAKPTLAACEALALDIQTIFTGLVPAELERRQTEKVRLAANTFLAAIEEYEDILRPKPAFREVRNVLSRFGAIPLAPGPPRRGRPAEAWHLAAHPIADAIKATLDKSEFKGATSAKVETAPIVIVGAKVIRRAYRVDIKDAAFASALKTRRRTMVAFFDSLSPPPHQGIEGKDFRTLERRDPPADWDD
jgi:hypothetical protein